MFGFLRKLRKTIFTESSSTRYVKYAIGEILLVVIGILIALQINNWNEKRKSQIAANELTEKLKLEIAENVDYLKFTDEGIEYQLSYLKLILDENVKNIDTLLTLPRFGLSPIIFMSSYSQFFDPPSDIYETAINDGSIRLINDKSLTRLLQDFHQSVKTRLNEFIREEYAQSREINNYISDHYGTLFKENAVTPDYKWNNQVTKELLLKVKNDGALKFKIMDRIELKRARQRFVKLYIKRFETHLNKED